MPAHPIDRIEKLVRRAAAPVAADPMQYAYEAGYDAAINGASASNCHYAIFCSPDRTREWERGNAAGKRAQKEPPCLPPAA
jgi:ribosome modulation factor